jgi:hypothetical protein
MKVRFPFISDFGTSRYLPAALLLVWFTVNSGCATSSRPAASPAPPPVYTFEPPEPSIPSHTAATVAASRNVEQLLRTEVARWEGVPHRLGGMTMDGVDCSALVLLVYRELFNMTLPRTTTEQVASGETVDPSELRAGDLVFFRPSKSQHVGIYLNDGAFAHASESRGVTISDINDQYWQDAWWTARRVLPEELTSAAYMPVYLETAPEEKPTVETEPQIRTASAPQAPPPRRW